MSSHDMNDFSDRFLINQSNADAVRLGQLDLPQILHQALAIRKKLLVN
jgi:hypothetical protein